MTIAVTPQITFVADPPVVRVGQSVLLTCTIIAEPMANFSEIVCIMPSGEEISLISDNNPLGDTLQYTFENATFPRDDRALFQCRAINANGEAVQNLTITVQGIYI